MTLQDFLWLNRLQKPLVAIQGDIFKTEAHYIAFAVHWRNSKGELNNANGGFAGMVAKLGWPELETYEFKKGVPIIKFIEGKYYCALPVHVNDENGWDETPFLIEEALNALPVSSVDVIACVMIGGGYAGRKYFANVNNLQGFMRTYKTIVMYVYDKEYYDLLLDCKIIAEPTSYDTPLTRLPKVYHLRDKIIGADLLQLQ